MAEAARLICARCGAAFDCRPDGACWCAGEDFQLPMPAQPDAQCLCPNCLREAARRHDPVTNAL
jgi:Cysteine-rich CWC